ncbi:MAG: DUF2892 domain-containing protein [Gammaproteobacteria bacterium]|nr:DUF2892 domain-containing protein [Gammaproteobacteria bacterium]
MKKNVGSIDRAVRLIVGLAVIAAGVYFQNWWGAIGVIFVATSAMGWCPPYALFGINSCSVDSTKA